jgi:hypothetical protein
VKIVLGEEKKKRKKQLFLCGFFLQSLQAILSEEGCVELHISG